MNHKCHGDYVKSIRLYRCLMDGTILKDIEQPETCPHCKRDVSAEVHEAAEMWKVEQTVVVIGAIEFVLDVKRTEIRERD